jgi:hypothetical protein
MKLMEMPFTGTSALDFGQEWGFHKDCLDIWRFAGYASGNGRMFFYGCRAISRKSLVSRRCCCSVSLDEFQSGKSFEETVYGKAADLVAEPSATLKCKDLLALDYSAKGGKVSAKGDGFSFDLGFSSRKDPVWISETGFLKVGDSGGQALCAAVTSLNIQGEAFVGEKKSVVTGKAWIDRISGPLDFKKASSHWEWLTLRFFSNEEIMIFSFPGSSQRAGTYVKRDGTVAPLTDFELEATSFASPDEKSKYACGWELRANGKEYSITPIADGVVKFGAYELWAEICNDSGDQAGICFAQVMPGTRSPKFKKQFSVAAPLKFPWQKDKSKKEKD